MRLATPSIDIVIRSYYRDQHWLALALRSIELFVTGYRQVVVVLPRASLARVGGGVIPASPRVRMCTCPDYADDYLGQQLTKLQADCFTDAQTIVHLDSDQIFVAPCELSDRLFDGGRLRVAFSSGGRPETDGWRRSPAEFLGRPVLVDLTTPPPLALPRDVYAAVRDLCQRIHQRSIADYVLTTRSDRLCEVALLRACALTTKPERYAWIDADRHELVPECRSFWSRTQTPAAVKAYLPPALASQVSGS